MPYIKNIESSRLFLTLGNDTFDIKHAGELNYLITALCIQYIQGKGLSYQTLNDVVGALEGAKAEFQRRVVIPYEDQKIAENGDVYPSELTGNKS